MNLNSHYQLSQQQIDQFRQDGFIKLKDVLDAETLTYYGEEITRLTIELNTQHLPIAERSTYDKAFLQVMNLWQHSTKVEEFINFLPVLAYDGSSLPQRMPISTTGP